MNGAARFPLMALAGLSLIAALWAGLVRLGWNLPPLILNLPINHGPLMVVGFLGTLISLERAVALKRFWTFGAPFFAGLSALALLAGLPLQLSHILAAVGGLFLVCIFIFLYSQHPSGHLMTMGIGAFLWLVGILLWHVGNPLHQVVPWWIGFLVFTIAGERLELSRLMRLSTWSLAWFLISNGVFLAGLIVALVASDIGLRLCGLGLVTLAVWLFLNDIAWRTVRQTGLPRFMGVCLITGYIWLGIGGLLWIGFAERFTAGLYYDAMLHAIFIGFVFSMIFAHAPIIFPAVTGVSMPFRRAFYSYLALLHLSLLLRVGGDLLDWGVGRSWGGLLNALAILLFLANNIRSARSERFSHL